MKKHSHKISRHVETKHAHSHASSHAEKKMEEVEGGLSGKGFIFKGKGKDAKEIEKEVRELYSDDEGNLPDLTTVSRVRTHRVRNFLITLGVLLAVGGSSAWAASAFYFSQSKPVAAPEILVDVPGQVKSGDMATLTIHYAAPRKTGISSLVIETKFPNTFLLKTSDQEAKGANRWVVDHLAAGEEGDLHLTGVVQGGDSAPQIVEVRATYVPENFQSPFELSASNAYSVTGSVVQVSALAPDRVQPGDAVSVTFTYKNPGLEDLHDVAFRITPPAGFVVSSSTQAQSGQLFWKLPVFAAGSSGTAKVIGSFASDAKGVSVFVGEYGAVRGADFVAQTTNSAPVSVLGGDLVLTTLVNGSASSTPVAFGDTLRMTLAYANRSEASLEDVRLVLNLGDGKDPKSGRLLFDPQSLVSSVPGVFVTSTQTMTWTKKQLPGLAKMKSGEEGTIDITVNLADAKATTKPDTSIAVSFQGSMTGVNGIAKKRQVQATSLVFPFISDTKLSSEARYYNLDEIPVGSGPIPPRPGAETLYRAYWTITNSLHEIQNVEAHATLPKGVRYTGKQSASAGVLTYNEKTRVVTWTVNKLPAKAPTVNIDFEIGVTPLDTDIGKTLPLLGETTLTTTDAAANAVITKKAGALDTTLPNDLLGKGNGAVVGE